MRLACAALVALVTLSVTAPAEALVQWYSVDWNGSRQINFTVAGTSITRANIGPAKGYTDGARDAVHTPGFNTHAKVFCVDVFAYAYHGPSREYEVDVHSSADGDAGWSTPVGDGDAWRDHGNVRRAGYLVNKYARIGGVWGSGAWVDAGGLADEFNRRVALNVAVWAATYGKVEDGGRFHLTGTGNFTATQLGYYNMIMADYSLGRQSWNYQWFDSKAGDSPSEQQDFIEGIPEPGTLLLLGSGLLGSALVFRRRRN